MNFDLSLFNYINGFANKSKMVDSFVKFSAVVLAPIMLVSLALLAISSKNVDVFVMPFASAVIARFAINELIYKFYKRKRPMEVMNVKQLIREPSYPSFPSGHTSAFFALSFALMPYNLVAGIIFLLLSSLISFSRIFSGVHWPSDIFGGIICGYVSFLIIYFILIKPSL